MLTPSAKTVDLDQTCVLTPDSPCHCTSSTFCELKLSVLVWVLAQVKQSPARLTKNGESFSLMMPFDLENVDPRTQNLHQKEFLCASIYVPSLVFLGTLYAPPSRTGNSQTLCSARVNPHPGRAFSITRPGRGNATPWHFETKRRSASQKNNRLLSTSTRDWWYIC